MAYAEILELLHPLGLLRGETPDTLRSKVVAWDGEEEFLEQLQSDRRRTLSTVVAALDPNALLNPAEGALAVAAWKPPLWAHLGYQGSYDPKARRARIEDQGRLLAEEPVFHACHTAVAWNRALADQGLVMLVLDLGTDDESFLAVPQAVAERIRQEKLLAVSPPCPPPKRPVRVDSR